MAGTAILGWLTLMLAATEPAPPSADAAPDAELLMYLGEFQDAQGEFVDPLALEAAEADEAAPTAAKEDDEHEHAPR